MARWQSSDAESIRIAARYIHDMGDGVSIQISAMWEDLEYEFNNVTSVRSNAMAAFGFGHIRFRQLWRLAGDNEVKAQKTHLGLNEDLWNCLDNDDDSGACHWCGCANRFCMAPLPK